MKLQKNRKDHSEIIAFFRWSSKIIGNFTAGLYLLIGIGLSITQTKQDQFSPEIAWLTLILATFILGTIISWHHERTGSYLLISWTILTIALSPLFIPLQKFLLPIVVTTPYIIYSSLYLSSRYLQRRQLQVS